MRKQRAAHWRNDGPWHQSGGASTLKDFDGAGSSPDRWPRRPPGLRAPGDEQAPERTRAAIRGRLHSERPVAAIFTRRCRCRGQTLLQQRERGLACSARGALPRGFQGLASVAERFLPSVSALPVAGARKAAPWRCTQAHQCIAEASAAAPCGPQRPAKCARC